MSQERSIDVHRSFDLLRPLGEGAMGEVWDALETELGQSVAVKVLKPEIANHAALRERFENEAEITASIDHPGSLPVYGIGVTVDGRPFYAMRKVAGRTLEELFVERGDRASDLTWQRKMLEILERVSVTLGYAHQRGIVHRDVKPENVLIDESGSVYVADWGIAKRLDDPHRSTGTVLGQVLGTPGYMSPEQARGDAVKAGPEADVFALGVILYRILTGKEPFRGEDAYNVMLQAQYREPADPRRSNVWVTRGLAAICSKALEKQPDRRYHDAAVFAADLRRHLDGHPVSVVSPTVRERLVRWARQRPWQALTVWSLILAAFLLLAFFLVQVALDSRMEQRVRADLEGIDGQILDLTEELQSIQLARETAAGDDAERLAHQWRVGVNRRVLLELEALSLLDSLASLRFLRTDRGLRLTAKTRVFSLLDRAIAVREPEVAAAFVTTALERHHEGVLRLDLTENDVRRLESIGTQARDMMVVGGIQSVPVLPQNATGESPTTEEQDRP